MVICVVPKPIKDAYAAGHWKDIASFKLLLDDLGLTYKIIYLGHNQSDKLLDLCGPDVTDVVIYYSFWANLFKDIHCISTFIAKEMFNVSLP